MNGQTLLYFAQIGTVHAVRNVYLIEPLPHLGCDFTYEAHHSGLSDLYLASQIWLEFCILGGRLEGWQK